ncbi:MAG: type I 3-dehydroquinate dehydratase, partial [Synergistaceae bacterium]|nr:type I 3-dehydroquinate dehydratase [Synergistaceae bacterium]
MKTLNVRGVELGAGVPKTIVPIVAKTKADILAKAKEITQLPADLVEWRADFYEDLFHTPKLLETLKELRGV